MPELPEVETMVRGIRPHVEGRRIAKVLACPTPCKPISVVPGFAEAAKRMQGATVRRVRRVAKRVVFDLSTDESCVVEPRMTGLMLLADPPDQEHLRIEWRFVSGGEYDSVWFWDRRGLGTVRLYTNQEFADKLGPRLLGPDALDMTEREWLDRLAGTARAIKVALLDQRLTAGIGNLYASEILHEAGIHPERRADHLNADEVHRLYLAARRILREAIKHEGSTLSDETYRNVLSRNGRYQNKHRVYKRSGTVCGTCRGGTIVRIVQAQRSTFFCPACQVKGKRRQATGKKL